VWSAIGTGVAAVVAIIAAGFALWQARIARDARDATVDQASSAREAVAVARAELDRAEQPQFAIEVNDHGSGVAPYIRVRMISGPPEIIVALEWTRQHVWPEGGGLQDLVEIGTAHQHMVKNQAIALDISAHGQAVMVSTSVTIESTEVGGRERTWTHHEVSDWRRPYGGL
jgi:hypothetical protein